jgi:hypothetical protein
MHDKPMPESLLNPTRRNFLGWAAWNIRNRKKDEKYRPSNGNEGEMFMSRWCEHCKAEEGYANGTGDSCPILVNVMCYSVDEPEYPSEWRYGPDGQPECASFLDRDAPPPRPLDSPGQGLLFGGS